MPVAFSTSNTMELYKTYVVFMPGFTYYYGRFLICNLLEVLPGLETINVSHLVQVLAVADACEWQLLSSKDNITTDGWSRARRSSEECVKWVSSTNLSWQVPKCVLVRTKPGKSMLENRIFGTYFQLLDKITRTTLCDFSNISL